MKKNVLSLALILFLFFTTTYAQDDNPVIKEYKEGWDAEKGYIITQNDEYKQGYLLINKDINNSEYVDFLSYIKAQPERFTIENIKEYGYNEIVYVTIPYKGGIVFMRRMNTKEPYVYYYKSKDVREFYIIKEKELVLLPSEKTALRDFLKTELSNCEISSKNAALAIYNKQRLTYIFERHSTCDQDRIPYFNYGMYLGYGLSNLKLDPNRVISFYNANSTIPGYVSMEVGDLSGQFESAYFGGIFADIPLTVYGGKLSVHPEIQFKRAEYSYMKNTYGEFGFDINYYATNILVRYKTLNPQRALFFDFGFNYLIIDVNNPYFLNTNTNDKYILNHGMENAAFGLVAGAGISIPFSVRNTVDISLRYSYLYSQSKMPTVSNFDFLVAIGL